MDKTIFAIEIEEKDQNDMIEDYDLRQYKNQGHYRKIKRGLCHCCFFNIGSVSTTRNSSLRLLNIT